MFFKTLITIIKVKYQIARVQVLAEEYLKTCSSLDDHRTLSGMLDDLWYAHHSIDSWEIATMNQAITRLKRHA